LRQFVYVGARHKGLLSRSREDRNANGRVALDFADAALEIQNRPPIQCVIFFRAVYRNQRYRVFHFIEQVLVFHSQTAYQLG
jgi:hypothetical protein